MRPRDDAPRDEIDSLRERQGENKRQRRVRGNARTALRTDRNAGKDVKRGDLY